jgi:SAM-dependent methyltransferase
MGPPDRRKARQLADESLKRGDALGWFEELYAQAEGDATAIPWADLDVNPHLAEWLAREEPAAKGRRALVVGCGLGDDAQALAARGFTVVAFDLSATAVNWCRQRFPGSPVEFEVASVLELPPHWQRAFDLVVEIYTLQVLPLELRGPAAQAIANTVAPEGTLVIIARGREVHEDPGSMPWPLVESELDLFTQAGLQLVRFENFFDNEDPPVRRFRAQFVRDPLN